MSTTVPHESQTQIKSDRAALDLWPALGGRCRPEDLRRVQRYARECCDQLDGASRKKVWELTIVDKEGLEPAATRVLREDQMEMLAREGGIDEFVAVELHFVQLWCLNALLHLHRASFKFAKETQIRVANGRPLTICVGAEKRRPVTTIAGTYHVTGGSCYRVFEDSLRLDARPFAAGAPTAGGARRESANARRSPWRIVIKSSRTCGQIKSRTLRARSPPLGRSSSRSLNARTSLSPAASRRRSRLLGHFCLACRSIARPCNHDGEEHNRRPSTGSCVHRPRCPRRAPRRSAGKRSKPRRRDPTGDRRARPART